MRGLLATSILFAFPIAYAAAQGTSVSTACCSSLHPRILVGIVTSEDGMPPARHQWVRAVILWRGDRPIQDGYSRDARVEARALDDAAERAGRIRLGAFYANRVHGADVSRDGTFLWVLGQQFTLPLRDSALVILVDHVDSASPTIDGTAHIAATLPAEYWGKVWESGDTTFLIRPRNTADHLRQALAISPQIQRFLDAR